MEPEKKPSAFAVLKIKDFKYLLLARFLLTMGIQMQSVIVGWQVYAHTKDALSLGLIGLAEAIPFLLIALFAGHWADIYNRKRIIVLSTCVYGFAAFMLLLITWKFQFVLDQYGIYPIFAIITLTGIARGCGFPAASAIIPQIVPREQYTNSSTWNSAAWQIAAVTGPAFGGLAYGFLGVNISYSIVVTLIAGSIISVLLVKSRPVPEREKKETISESLKQGFRFVFNNQIVLGSLSLDMFAVLFGGAVAVLPMFADQILHVGPEGLGFLRAAPSIGALIMAGIMAYKPSLNHAGRNLLGSVAIFGISTILFAVSTNFYLSLLMLAVTGMFDMVSVILRSTIIQLYTPDSMRGRVSAINSIFIGSSNEIGAFESGVAAKFLRLVPSVVMGGSMVLVVVGAIAKKAPKLRQLNMEKEMNQEV